MPIPPSAPDAIANLIFTYAERLDLGDLAGVAALFADATFGSVGGGHYRGAAEVLATLTRLVRLYEDGTPRTKHVTTNVIVAVDETAAAATARSYFTVLQACAGLPLQPIIAGRYHDRFAAADGVWRFAERLIHVDLTGDLSHHLKR